jgi:Tol biopolymer transport system component
MNDARSITLESAPRAQHLILLVAAAAVVSFLGLRLLTMEGADLPRGIIGYRLDGREVWMRANGQAVAEPDGVPGDPVSSAGNAGEFPSADGRMVAFMELSNAGAWLSVREGETVRRVGRLADAGSPQLISGPKGAALDNGGVPLVAAWSPDGTRLAWGSVMQPPYNLHVANTGDWRARSLPLVGGWAGELAWSPDGRFLAISTYAENRTDHTLLILDTLVNDPPRQLAKGCVLVWSPDSRHVALHGEPVTQPGLWIISVDGQARQVSQRTAVAPFAWLPD